MCVFFTNPALTVNVCVGHSDVKTDMGRPPVFDCAPVSDGEALAALRSIGDDIQRLTLKGQNHLTLPTLYPERYPEPTKKSSRMWQLWKLYFSQTAAVAPHATDCPVVWAGGWGSPFGEAKSCQGRTPRECGSRWRSSSPDPGYYGMRTLCNRSYSLGCTTISYGVEADYTFELDLAERTGCEGFALDPTVRHRRPHTHHPWSSSQHALTIPHAWHAPMRQIYLPFLVHCHCQGVARAEPPLQKGGRAGRTVGARMRPSVVLGFAPREATRVRELFYLAHGSAFAAERRLDARHAGGAGAARLGRPASRSTAEDGLRGAFHTLRVVPSE